MVVLWWCYGGVRRLSQVDMGEQKRGREARQGGKQRAAKREHNHTHLSFIRVIIPLHDSPQKQGTDD
jgi:hypothetical protein